MNAKDLGAIAECLHADYTFIRHQSGTSINKTQMVDMMRGFFASEAVVIHSNRCVFENHEIIVEHTVMDFADGSREDLDAVLWATGYKITFPFFDDPALSAPDNHFPLFKRIVKPGYENLYFLGLAQAVPTLVNFVEQQSKWVVDHMTGKYTLPDTEEMERIISADERRFLESRAATVLQKGTYRREQLTAEVMALARGAGDAA